MRLWKFQSRKVNGMELHGYGARPPRTFRTPTLSPNIGKVISYIGLVGSEQAMHSRVRWRRVRCSSVWVSRRRRSGAPAVPRWVANRDACRDVLVRADRLCQRRATTSDGRRSGSASYRQVEHPSRRCSGRRHRRHWNLSSSSETSVYTARNAQRAKQLAAIL